MKKSSYITILLILITSVNAKTIQIDCPILKGNYHDDQKIFDTPSHLDWIIITEDQESANIDTNWDILYSAYMIQDIPFCVGVATDRPNPQVFGIGAVIESLYTNCQVSAKKQFTCNILSTD